jgi:hypothetical protein
MAVLKITSIAIVDILEGASGNKMTLGEILGSSEMREHLTEIIRDLQARHIVSLSSGELSDETIVTLAHG